MRSPVHLAGDGSGRPSRLGIFDVQPRPTTASREWDLRPQTPPPAFNVFRSNKGLTLALSRIRRLADDISSQNDHSRKACTVNTPSRTVPPQKNQAIRPANILETSVSRSLLCSIDERWPWPPDNNPAIVLSGDLEIAERQRNASYVRQAQPIVSRSKNQRIMVRCLSNPRPNPKTPYHLPQLINPI